jgi:DNA-binding response OmpR family regulator
LHGLASVLDNRPRILVAEGGTEQRAFLVWGLLAHGFWVEPVSNGFDAAVALESPVAPDLAIIDLYLPGFEGRRLIESMRQSQRLRRVPILVTAFSAPYAPLPADVAFMTKPCSIDALIAKVGEVGGHRVRDAVAGNGNGPRPAQSPVRGRRAVEPRE